ncbi:MAG: mechanosensitive ion channel family protein [Pseudomonadota bacterium]
MGQFLEDLHARFDGGVAYLESVWDEGAFGLTYGEIIVAVGVIVASLMVRGLFARTVVRTISRAAAGTDTQIDDALVKAIATPLKIVPVIIGAYIAVQVVDIEGEAAILADKIVQSVIAIAVFWTLSRAVNAFEFLFTGLKSNLSPAIVDWMAKTLQVVLVIIGFGAVVDIWGYSIAPIIASLGVLGIAVGLGAQDLFKNLIAGILILGERRFLPGEWIKVDGVVEGTVEKINFRSTLIRRFDKSPVYVPNAMLSDNAVTNFARMTHRRIKWVVGVEYRTTVEQLRFIRDETEAWLWTDPRFSNPPETALFVRIDSFNDSSIDFLIYCFTRTTNWGEWLEIKEDLALAMIDIVERAGTSFAFPSRTLYMQEQDPPEIVQPPEVSERVRRLLEEKSTARARGGSDDGGE